MKTIGKKIGTGMIALLIAAAMIPAAADACQGRRGGGGQGMNCNMMGGGGCGMRGGGPAFGIWQNQQAIQDLGLTPEQVGKLRDADFAAREKHLPMMAELDGLRLQMDRAFAVDPVDEKLVLQLSEKIAAAKGRMSVVRTEEQLALRKLLTPEQNAKLSLLPQSGRGGMGKPCNGQGPNGMSGTGRPCKMNGQGPNGNAQN